MIVLRWLLLRTPQSHVLGVALPLLKIRSKNAAVSDGVYRKENAIPLGKRYNVFHALPPTPPICIAVDHEFYLGNQNSALHWKREKADETDTESLGQRRTCVNCNGYRWEKINEKTKNYWNMHSCLSDQRSCTGKQSIKKRNILTRRKN